MNYRWLTDLQDPLDLTLGVTALVWSGWYLYRAVLRPRALRSGAACGACGYAISPPITARCPECGGDFAEVGLATAALASRLRASATSVVLAWVLFCTLLAFPVRAILGGMLMGLLPHYRTVYSRGDYELLSSAPGRMLPYSLTVMCATSRRIDEPFASRGFVGVNLGTVGSGSTPPSGPLEQLDFQLETGTVVLISHGSRVYQGATLSVGASESMIARLDPTLTRDLVAKHAAAIRAIPACLAESPESPSNGVAEAYGLAGLEPVSTPSGLLRTSEIAGAKIPTIGLVEAETLALIPIGVLTLAGAILVARRHRRLTRAMRAVPAST